MRRKKVLSERKEAARGHSVQFRVSSLFGSFLKGSFLFLPLLQRLKGEHFFPEKRRKERRRKEGESEGRGEGGKSKKEETNRIEDEHFSQQMNSFMVSLSGQGVEST